MSERQDLRPETIKKLDELLEEPAIKSRVVSMKIWRLDGTIVYSTFKDMVGRRFPPSNLFMQAASGEVAAEFSGKPHIEDEHERTLGKPLFEIYAPVRSQTTRRVIAVSEFYATVEQLSGALDKASALSWLVVGLVTSLMMLALSSIVYRGSRMIDAQREQLRSQVIELTALVQQNDELQRRLHLSREDIADINERTLQRIGADLHDGPAQLLAYAMLRLNKLGSMIQSGDFEQASKDLARMRIAIEDSLKEVRTLSAGLAMPELDSATLEETIMLVIANHEQHTGTLVERELEINLDHVPHVIKVCVYRFVQEALSNAFWHAGGQGQRVVASGGIPLQVSVSDDGPGMQAGNKRESALGLSGLRARIEAHGGLLTVASGPQAGTRLTVSFSANALRRRGAEIDKVSDARSA